MYVWNATVLVLIFCSLIVFQGSCPSFKVVQFMGKQPKKFIKGRLIFFICPSPMFLEEQCNVYVCNVTILVLIFFVCCCNLNVGCQPLK
jgi:hypothetical protein